MRNSRNSRKQFHKHELKETLDSKKNDIMPKFSLKLLLFISNLLMSKF